MWTVADGSKQVGQWLWACRVGQRLAGVNIYYSGEASVHMAFIHPRVKQPAPVLDGSIASSQVSRCGESASLR